MSLNGIVLLSAVLDFATLRATSGMDHSHSVFLPTYATVAHHHGKIKGNRDIILANAKAFAFDEYAAALIQGSELPKKRQTEIAEKLGFSTVYYFSRLFKKKTGCSPSSYRQR